MGSCPRDSGTPSACSAIGTWFSGGRLGQRENDHRLPSGNPPGWSPIVSSAGESSPGLWGILASLPLGASALVQLVPGLRKGAFSGLPRRDQMDGVGAFLGGDLGAAFKVPHDVGGDKDDQFLLRLGVEGASEELAQEGDVTQEWDLGQVLGDLGLDRKST